MHVGYNTGKVPARWVKCNHSKVQTSATGFWQSACCSFFVFLCCVLCVYIFFFNVMVFFIICHVLSLYFRLISSISWWFLSSLMSCSSFNFKIENSNVVSTYAFLDLLLFITFELRRYFQIIKSEANYTGRSLGLSLAYSQEGFMYNVYHNTELFKSMICS